jgi:chaperonin GroEL
MISAFFSFPRSSFGMAAASAIDVKRGLDRGLKATVAALSAHNDTALGDFVAEAMDKVGSDSRCC